MEEEIISRTDSLDYQNLPFCKCLYDDTVSAPVSPSEEMLIPERKQFVLSTVPRTETYLRERRIPELIRFLLTMILADLPENPIVFLEKLLDDCMIFRLGHGIAPVLYENRHLEAVIKSFDPGNRGWLSAGQVYRIYTTLGFNMVKLSENRLSCDMMLNSLKKIQEEELFELLAAGNKTDNIKSDSPIN